MSENLQNVELREGVKFKFYYDGEKYMYYRASVIDGFVKVKWCDDDGSFEANYTLSDANLYLHKKIWNVTAVSEPVAQPEKYTNDQWWVKELDTIQGVMELTPDQYRAINIARNYIKTNLTK